MRKGLIVVACRAWPERAVERRGREAAELPAPPANAPGVADPTARRGRPGRSRDQRFRGLRVITRDVATGARSEPNEHPLRFRFTPREGIGFRMMASARGRYRIEQREFPGKLVHDEVVDVVPGPEIVVGWPE